jgi:hypothetical protein
VDRFVEHDVGRDEAVRSLLALALALALGVSIAACGGDDPSAPDPLPVSDDTSYTKSPAATPSGSASADPPSTSSAASGARRWKGTLARTSTVTFGASSCSYRITLQNVAVDILELDDDIVTATVTLTATEETVPPCTAPPIRPNAHTYVLSSASRLPNGMRHIELSPMAANRPAAALVIEGAMSTPKSTLDLSWHRIDNPAPFDWRVRAQVVASALSRP